VSKILIIEDDYASAELFLEFFREEGYEPTAVRNAFSALKAIQEIPFDVVFMGLTLPGMNPRDFVREVADIPHPPIVLFSALPGSELEWAGRQLKAVAVLPKPSDLELILEAVQTAVESDRLACYPPKHEMEG
jgi:CheY-like chemotaxis protein